MNNTEPCPLTEEQRRITRRLLEPPPPASPWLAVLLGALAGLLVGAAIEVMVR